MQEAGRNTIHNCRCCYRKAEGVPCMREPEGMLPLAADHVRPQLWAVKVHVGQSNAAMT
jgi:hypothetical protein